MNLTLRVLAGIGAGLCLAFLLALLNLGLSVWMDHSFNHLRIKNENIGYSLSFLNPLFLGAISGLITGPLFFIADRKSQGLSSVIAGTVGLCITGVLCASLAQSYIGTKGALILCGPAMLWMFGLILFGIWQLMRNRNTLNTIASERIKH